MKRNALASVVAAGLVLAGCGSKQDANEKNFSNAMSKYLAAKGQLCLSAQAWPVTVDQSDLRMMSSIPTGIAGKMDALEKVGLLAHESVQVDAKDFFGKSTGAKVTVLRYSPTEAAKPYMVTSQETAFSVDGPKQVTKGRLCFAREELDAVVKWEGPMKFGDYQEARVKYKSKIVDVAKWAQDQAVQKAFPMTASSLDKAGKLQQHSVKLTSEGWEAVGLDS
ncbi:hypothetical protein [Pandoraea sp. NPDC090278]|uniref:hypothetical protein n=1 Tax=Pandoraea sp. NPDC090278 TaxID=3364391 RepID=UPI00383AC0A6